MGPCAPAGEVSDGLRPWSVSTLPTPASTGHPSPGHRPASCWYSCRYGAGMSSAAAVAVYVTGRALANPATSAALQDATPAVRTVAVLASMLGGVTTRP